MNATGGYRAKAKKKAKINQTNLILIPHKAKAKSDPRKN